MKKRFAEIIVLAFFILSTTSCRRPDFKCSPPARPTASSNSPVMLGKSINLTTDYVSGASYHWYGPNGFNSDEQNPTITRSTLANNGKYYLSISVDECESNTSSTDVFVNTPTPPCGPANNTGDFGAFATVNFNSVWGHIYSSQYQIDASGSQFALFIEFADTSKPTDGVYTICPDCPTGFLTKNEVCIKILRFYWYYALSGDIYVSHSNGKISVTFCDMPFSGQSFNFTGTAKFTEQ